MINQGTLEQLRTLRLAGFVGALLEQDRHEQEYQSLSFDERLTLLVEAETTRRKNQQIETLIRQSKVTTTQSIKDLELSKARGFNKNQILTYAKGEWLSSKKNLIITGKTGVGKTFLAGVIARELCSRGLAVRFQKTHQWITELLVANHKGKLAPLVTSLGKVPLLVFDEWLRDRVSAEHSRYLLDLIDNRYETGSVLLLSQFPVKSWYERFEEPTIADALMDRIVHNSERIELEGDSMRKQKHLGKGG